MMREKFIHISEREMEQEKQNNSTTIESFDTYFIPNDFIFSITKRYEDPLYFPVKIKVHHNKFSGVVKAKRQSKKSKNKKK